MARIISKRWNEADIIVKAPFYHKANMEKLRYLREKQEYSDEMKRRAQMEAQRKEVVGDAAFSSRDSPRILVTPGQDPYIAELSRKLDQETVDLIVRIFS